MLSCPSTSATSSSGTPAADISDAAECRISYGVHRPIPARSHAWQKYRRRFDESIGRPVAVVNTSCAPAMVDLARQTPVEEEANSLASWLCFRRAVEQLRVAYMAAVMGHYSEIDLLVRAVYESAGLGRKLALEPRNGERWLREGAWHPDCVRSALGLIAAVAVRLRVLCHPAAPANQSRPSVQSRP